MSTSQFNPMPFKDPDDPSQNNPESATSDNARAEAENPLYEHDEPDANQTPDEEDPDDQLLRE